MAKITPISGFAEFLPAQQIVMNNVIDLVKSHYERFGFTSIETPVVERTDTLLSKGSDNKEIYALRRLAAAEGEKDEKDLALRFDLTVPTARYVAQHFTNLTFPFKRYQIQPVWRGERPQVGRYRQFTQADIDVIGFEKLSLRFDAEMPAIIYGIFKELAVGNFTIRMNNRKILRGFLNSLGLEKLEDITEATRIVDRMEKVSGDKTKTDLAALGLNESAIEQLLAFFNLSGQTQQLLDTMGTMNVNEEFETGVAELGEVIRNMRLMGVGDDCFCIDPKIARGLDYYTGTIYETVLDDHRDLGTVCAGGRYENLAGQFTNKKLPGVGISIGLTRMVPELMKRGVLKEASRSTPADVLITAQSSEFEDEYIAIGTQMRDAGLKVEVYLDRKKLDKQMKYANKKGFPFVVIAGENEINAGKLLIRNLQDGAEKTLSTAEAITFIKQGTPS